MGETAVEKRLGRYQIVKHLASGGMAEVLLANATGIEGFERYVVIKRIHSEQARNAAFVQMFLDEARLAASLHHQHIVQVHDIGQENGEYFFAMEYVHGEDLRALLMKVNALKQVVPLEHVITILLASTAALHYAHEHRGPDRKPLGLVHRDVSPSNILVGYDGSIKVVDFGIAKAALRTDQTKSGVLKGKVAYMSPEQCRGKALDRRSDVYALGIVLYELLTARRLFKGESDFMTMSSIVASRIPRPSMRRADVPPQLDEIVLKALAKAPADRYQTADEMRRALEEFAASTGLRTSSSALSDYMHGMFGERPEPWLVTNDGEAEVDLTIDFDGSASGVAEIPTDPFDEISNPSGRDSSPIMRARTKSISSAPLATGVGGDLEKSAPHQSGTPMAWQPAIPDTQRRRPWLIVAVAVSVVVAGVAGMTVLMGGDDHARAVGRPADNGSENVPAQPTEARSETETAGSRVSVDGSGVGSGIGAGVGSGSGSADSGSGSGSGAVAGSAIADDGPVASRPKATKPTQKPKPKPKPKANPKTPPKPNPNADVPWDPNSLLPGAPP